MFTLLILAAVAAFVAFVVCRFGRPAPLAQLLRGAILAPIMILLALPAMAQEPVARGVLDAVMPQLLEIAGTLLSLALLWASVRFTKRTGIEIEARYRDALHSALMSGARLAISRQLTGPAALDLILSHVRHSVPDALGKLRPDEVILERLAEAKLQEAGDKLGRELSRAIGR